MAAGWYRRQWRGIVGRKKVWEAVGRYRRQRGGIGGSGEV